jgi:hypothetical protein
MPGIAERPEFMNARTVEVCAKTGFERNVRHKEACIRRQFSIKLPQNREILTVQVRFGKIISIERIE